MKKFLIVLMLFFASSSFAKTGFVKAKLQASGLTCSMCSFATEKSLLTLDFIDSVARDLDNTSFNLYFKKDKQVSLDQIKKKVQDAGFSVAVLIVTFNFENVAISNDFHYDFEGSQYHFMNVKNQNLNGNVDITIIDRGFVSDKQFKKYGKMTHHECYASGTMKNCCNMHGGEGETRVYHVTLN